MSKQQIEQIVMEMVQPIAQEYNVELVDVEFVKEGANWYLRIYIDKPEGIDLEDCSNVSHRVSELLDQRDPIDQAYYLEVSSPGLDRPIKKDADFVKYQGRLVKVNTYAAIDGQKSFVGKLIGLKDSEILLQVGEDTLAFPREKVSSVRLEVEF